MIRKKSFTIFLLVSIIFIIYKIIENNYYESKNKFTNNPEGFTTGFRVMYRPRIRNIRLIGEQYYNKFKNNMHVIFRKIGII
jgi:hypothetical protein